MIQMDMLVNECSVFHNSLLNNIVVIYKTLIKIMLPLNFQQNAVKREKNILRKFVKMSWESLVTNL